MWLAMGSLTMLSLDSNVKRRIWFICDELPSLHKLPLLGETIAEVRKFGGCFLLGMQSFAQLEKVYGLVRFLIYSIRGFSSEARVVKWRVLCHVS